MKKIFFLILLCFLVFVVYHFTFKKEDLFFSIGNEKGDYYYKKENMKITELKMGIEQNEIIQDIPIQQILVKSSKIQIDSNSFFTIKSYHRILEQLEDLEELFKILRKYCKEKIEFILLRGSDEGTSYANKKISILCKKYDIIIMR